MARTHGSTSFVEMTINQLLALGFSEDEPFLASRVSLQKRAAARFAETFSYVPPVKEVEPEVKVEEFKF
jgi:hypothetical protein